MNSRVEKYCVLKKYLGLTPTNLRDFVVINRPTHWGYSIGHSEFLEGLVVQRLFDQGFYASVRSHDKAMLIKAFKDFPARNRRRILGPKYYVAEKIIQDTIDNSATGMKDRLIRRLR